MKFLMSVFGRCRCLAVAAVWLLYASAELRADGCIIGKGGEYVPVTEQRAFIEWDGGQERLFLATRTGESQGPTVWIVPVPASAEQVKAEPVERLRHFFAARALVESAQETLGDTCHLTLALDSGLLPIILPRFGRGANTTFTRVPGPVRLGQVVQVVTVQSAETLDRYLAEKQLDVRAADITALEPYLKGEYALVCAWAAAPAGPSSARAVRIDFPTPIVFYPLQPARVFRAPIETTLHVRGWVQPKEDVTLPGLRCRYFRGQVADITLDEAFGSRRSPFYSFQRAGGLLTLVEVTGSPQGWTQDLFLEPGAPTAIFIAKHTERLGQTWRLSVLLGAVIASFLPWALIARGERRWTDWIWAGGLGILIGLSVFASALVLYAWSRRRLPVAQQRRLGLLGWASAGCVFVVSLPMLFLVLLNAVWPPPVGTWMNAPGVHFFVIPGLFILIVVLPVAAVCLARAAAGPKAVWLAVFALLHFGLVLGLCLGLGAWLGQYA